MSNIYQNIQLDRIATAIENGEAGGGTLTVNLSGMGDMTGATVGQAGVHGLVPAPAAGDQDKTLHGDGSWRVDSADLPQVFGSGSGSIITLTDAADYAASDLVIDIDPVQSGSGDPSPDNIRPISGWTGATVTRCGVNVWDEEWEVGGISSNTGQNTISTERVRSVNYISVIPNTYYYYKGTNSFRVFFYDANKNFIEADKTKNANIVFETPINCRYIRFIIVSNTIDDGISINYPATDTSYHAYTGQDYTITFPSEAGTVYGGTLDVTNGTLTVTKANIASYTGETLPGAWISDRDIYDPDNPTAPTTGAQVVYDLDTPLTYQVISTDVYLTSGICNVWANTGDIITMEYVKADYNDLMQAVPKMKMPDYSAAIASGTYNLFDGFNYTAVKDCIIYVMIGCDSSQSYPSVSVNNNSLGYIWSNTSGIEFPLFIPLKTGDTLNISATNQGNNWTETYIIFSI